MTTTGNISGKVGRSLILIHGRDYKPAAEDLMDISVAAMTAGIERDFPEDMDDFNALNKEQCYYGDLTNAFLIATGGNYDDQLDLGDRRNALQKLRSISKRKNFGVNRYDRLPGKTALREFAADVAASVGLSRAFIGKVAPELNEYWNKQSDFGDKVRERVRLTLTRALKRGDKILLVAHSTGSVVAYDVLWELSHDPRYAEEFANHKVDTWLTLGAPLGNSMVRRRLFGAGQKGRRRYPSNVVTWHNVSAEDDYFCHDNTLADDYRNMLKQRQVSSIRDYHIYNLTIRYGKSNPHSSLGYLIHPRMAQIISEWLNRSATDPVPTHIL